MRETGRYVDDASELREHERFLLARRRAGLTQVEVARALGVTQSMLSAYETGRVGFTLERRRRMWGTLELATGDVA